MIGMNELGFTGRLNVYENQNQTHMYSACFSTKRIAKMAQISYFKSNSTPMAQMVIGSGKLVRMEQHLIVYYYHCSTKMPPKKSRLGQLPPHCYPSGGTQYVARQIPRCMCMFCASRHDDAINAFVQVRECI